MINLVFHFLLKPHAKRAGANNRAAGVTWIFAGIFTFISYYNLF